MASRLETLEAESMDLPLEERVKLADRLIASVFRDNDIEEAWASEVERRVAEIEAGRTQMVPAADAIARARAEINR
jgi:putative addiction module component (TIGR02574 family)